MKKIFISDIHLGDERSFTSPNPYGWTISNISNLANFLEDQIKASDVAEMVILGDLFDTWVIPTNMDPLTSFAEICSYNNNLPVIDALKGLAKKNNFNLSYVPGNHDMAFSTGGLDLTKQFIENNFPGIHYICDPNLPYGLYRSGKLLAEHGNRYCLFNAPDPWTDAPSFLPIGYFIARLVAYKIHTTGNPENYLDILKRFIVRLIKRPNFVKDLFEAIAEDAGLEFDADIDMKALTNFTDPTKVGAISSLYGQLIENWEKNDRNKIGWETATIADAGDLSLAAYRVYFSIFGSGDQNIVIFGHTHMADLEPYPQGEPLGQDVGIPLDLPCLAIYANCGAWVDSVQSTYVETEEDRNAGRHYVRLYTYPDKTLKGEAFVEL